ncbi:hypothetical protein ACFSTC_12435 [Nonomuraea ferruginea]
MLERAHLINAVPAGRMIAVAAPEERIVPVLVSGGIDVDVAAGNGPSMTVLSGSPAEIEAASAALAGEGIACRALRSAHAFHSRLLQLDQGEARRGARHRAEAGASRPRRLQPHRPAAHRRAGHRHLLLGRPARQHSPLRRRRAPLRGPGRGRVRRTGARPDARRAGQAEPGRAAPASPCSAPCRPAGPAALPATPPRRTAPDLRPALGARRRGHLGTHPRRRGPRAQPAHLPLPAHPLLAGADHPSRHQPQRRPARRAGRRSRGSR